MACVGKMYDRNSTKARREEMENSFKILGSMLSLEDKLRLIIDVHHRV